MHLESQEAKALGVCSDQNNEENVEHAEATQNTSIVNCQES